MCGYALPEPTTASVLAAASSALCEPQGLLCEDAAPGFEGAEKRLELHFVLDARRAVGAGRAGASGAPRRAHRTWPALARCAPSLFQKGALTANAPPFARHARLLTRAPPPAAFGPPAGLRAISRADLDAFLATAECTIVSQLRNAECDSYVLSESSLFLFADKLMIKTCGTTALLKALPQLLALAASAGATPRRCRFSRASYMYAKAQPAPHRSWEEECAFLDAHFAAPARGTARVLGTPGDGLCWHVWSADAPAASRAALAVCEPNVRGGGSAAAGATLTLEVCMTQLDVKCAGAFIFGDAAAPPAALVTAATGIRDMFAGAAIDDFVFAPCGYSMNALQGAGLATIHVTPEARCSYASVEISGHAAQTYSPEELVRKALAVFRPGRVSVAITCDVHPKQGTAAAARPAAVPLAWAKAPLPEGYERTALSRVELPGGGWVTHATLALASPATPQA